MDGLKGLHAKFEFNPNLNWEPVDALNDGVDVIV